MDITDLVDYFKNYRRENARGRGSAADVKEQLGELEEIATERGLEHDAIQQLVDTASNGLLAQRVSIRLIKCLIPRSTVPQKAVLTAISWMCTNKPASNVQAHLIRWITLVYDYIDDHKPVHAMYGILFYFLENDQMCPYVCHLLYLMTRREDVKLFRVRALINLQKRVGNQTYLLGLLSIYKLYCPQLISMTLPRTPKNFFKQTDKPWDQKIKYVQDKNKEEEGERGEKGEKGSFNVTHLDLDTLGPAAKRRKLDLVPMLDVCTVHTNGSWQTTGLARFNKNKIPLKLIRTQAELLVNIDNIEMPARMASVLKNHQFQHLMSLQSDPVVPVRLGYWVHHALNEEFFQPLTPGRQERQAELLDLLCSFAHFLQESMPVWENFLTRYLLTWNGADHRESIFTLITMIRLAPPEALLEHILQPLRKLYFSSSILFKCQVIWCLTLLLRNYVAVEWPRHKEIIAAQDENTNIAHSYREKAYFHSVFHEEIEVFPALQTVKTLIEFVHRLMAVSLKAERQHTMLVHCYSDFNHMMCRLSEDWNVPVLILPHRTIIYQLMFSFDIIAVAYLAELLTHMRNVFQDLRHIRGTLPESTSSVCLESLQHVGTFNTYLLDLCNVLWRERAFDDRDNSGLTFVSKEDLQLTGVTKPQQAFSLNLHPALLPFSIRFVRVTQPVGSNVHVSNIRRVRDAFMDFLKLAQIKSIPEFISKSILRKESTPGKRQTSSKVF